AAFILILSPIIYPAITVRADNEPGSESSGAYALPAAKAGADYSYQFNSSGGLAPFSWQVIEGQLPPGITLDSSGKLQGKSADPSGESYKFAIEVSDSSQPPQRFSQWFSLTVEASPLRIVLNSGALKIVPPNDAPPSPRSSVLDQSFRWKDVDTSAPAPQPQLDRRVRVGGSVSSSASGTTAPATPSRSAASAAGASGNGPPAAVGLDNPTSPADTTPTSLRVFGRITSSLEDPS